MKRIFILFTLFASQISYGQIVNMTNPSFEGTAQPHVPPPPWLYCNYYTPDTQPGSWGITLPASDGSTYVGLVHDPSTNWQENVYQNLGSAVLGGLPYTITMDLAVPASVDPFSGIVPGPVELQIWASNHTGSGCDYSELLWSSGNISNTTWQNQTAFFVPTVNFTQISFVVSALDSVSVPYVLLDNLSPITPSGVAGVYATSTPVSCTGFCDGSVTAHMFGATPPFHFYWTPTGDTSATVSNLCEGMYYVSATDSSGSVYIDSVQVGLGSGTGSISPPPICIVSVDSSTQKNLVIWEKPVSASIDSFIIYRETSIFNQFDPIGAVDYNDMSVFLDNTAIPAQQSYRYKIGCTDTCGHTGSLSLAHTTIHLIVSPNMGNNQLSWNSYVGFGYSSFEILRGSSPTSMTYLTNISSGLNSYTDINPPAGYNYYAVLAKKLTPCIPSAKANQYVYSSSNVSWIFTSGIESFPVNRDNFTLSPNPSDDGFTLATDLPDPGCYFVRLLNVCGQEIRSENICDEVSHYFSTVGIDNGIYIVDIRIRDQWVRKRLVVSRD